MAKYKLRAGAGPHLEPASGDRAAKTVKAGKTVESDRELDKLFPNKFDKVVVVGGKQKVLRGDDAEAPKDDRASRVSHRATDRQKEPPEMRGLSEDEAENPSANETGDEGDGPDEVQAPDQNESEENEPEEEGTEEGAEGEEEEKTGKDVSKKFKAGKGVKVFQTDEGFEVQRGGKTVGGVAPNEKAVRQTLRKLSKK